MEKIADGREMDASKLLRLRRRFFAFHKVVSEGLFVIWQATPFLLLKIAE